MIPELSLQLIMHDLSPLPTVVPWPDTSRWLSANAWASIRSCSSWVLGAWMGVWFDEVFLLELLDCCVFSDSWIALARASSSDILELDVVLAVIGFRNGDWTGLWPLKVLDIAEADDRKAEPILLAVLLVCSCLAIAACAALDPAADSFGLTVFLTASFWHWWSYGKKWNV